VLSTDFGLPMHFVAADALNFRPAVILEAAGN
jgi:hypothetical protein